MPKGNIEIQGWKSLRSSVDEFPNTSLLSAVYGYTINETSEKNIRKSCSKKKKKKNSCTRKSSWSWRDYRVILSLYFSLRLAAQFTWWTLISQPALCGVCVGSFAIGSSVLVYWHWFTSIGVLQCIGLLLFANISDILGLFLGCHPYFRRRMNWHEDTAMIIIL